MSFSGGTVVKNPPSNAEDARDVGFTLRLERSLGEGNGTPLQYSCLENPMDRGVWWAIVHGVTKSQTQQLHHQQLKNISFSLLVSLWIG